MLGNATTRLFQGVVAKATHVPGAAIDFAYIGRMPLFCSVLYLLSAVFNYIQGYIMAGIAMKVTYNFRQRIAEKIKRLPLKYFDTKTHGEVLSHVTNDVDTINTTLTQNLSQIVTSVTTIIGVLIMMLTISWLMTLVALVILPLSFVLVSRGDQSLRSSTSTGSRTYLGHVNGHVEEMYGGHIVMKAFNGEEKSIQQFDRLNEELYGVAGSPSSSPADDADHELRRQPGLCRRQHLGGYLAVQGTIGVGDILAFIQYVRSFTMPITQTANIANVLQSTAAAAERVFEFLDEEEEMPEPAQRR